MLNKLDDYPIHQTSEPVAHPASSDRNVYDRYWFNGYSADGEYYFGLGMAVYPHRGILDCHFSVVEKGGRQHCFYGSRRAPDERTDLNVGPFTLHIVEAMRGTRVTIDDNETGISADLLFSPRTAAIEEVRQSFVKGTRRFMDATRFAQFGCWSGTIRHPDGEIKVDPAVCRATKDRSWGIRNVGEPASGGAPTPPDSAFFLWAPIQWDDHISHAIWFDGEQGEPLVREGIIAPKYASEADIPDGAEDGREEHMATALHRIDYVPGTRLARSAEIDLIAMDGKVRTISLEPMLKFQMKGLGYFHPEWAQGMWKGELAIGTESFDNMKLDMLDPHNIHVQQVVRATDGVNTGVGVLEQVCFGLHAPSGFTGMLDGAK